MTHTFYVGISNNDSIDTVFTTEHDFITADDLPSNTIYQRITVKRLGDMFCWVDLKNKIMQKENTPNIPPEDIVDFHHDLQILYNELSELEEEEY